nr:bestrophin homolog 17-like isoform X1 [Procambarus clarkii]XP_045611055.1 bestrophin homolog 17-like isoform X1 [Procambarus clarkii]XP_045611056.1 bestrophin homolog 17-like isoform X1 [Procambarus clarkii]
MTVTYTSQVATCSGFGCFWKLLFRWKGSIYKLVWPELLVYSIAFYLFSFTYRFALSEDQKRLFEKVSVFCQYFSDLIPLSFVLGFYVSIVVQRWWEQYLSLPWPDSLALFVSTSIHGQDERSRLMRRTVMRYVNLTELITLIMISPTVKKRFPTLDHLVEAGFMTSNEKKIFDALDEKTSHPKYWMPLVWAGSIVTRARKEGRIRDDFAVKTIIDEINRFRGLCGGLLSYDWISIPLVYTQVVTLAVYSFFLATIMGRQFLDPKQNINKHHVDFYVPIFTFLQFFFYMGWLKVAESLVNPFGEDDDDFEVNWLVDRNLQVSYLIVDEMHSEHPELIQDMYWDEVFPQELPYTIASEAFRREPPQGSTANIEVPDAEQEFLPMLEEEEDEGINESMSGYPGDVENGSKAIDIMKKSPRSSHSGIASSQPMPRKPSVLSMLWNRMKSDSHDNVRRAHIRPNASTTSFRHRRHRGLMRSASRVSSTSHVTSQSPEMIARNQTLAAQDSAIFRMSDLSINAPATDEISSPRPKGRLNSYDDDEPILIKIKRRDQDGHVIMSHSSDDFDMTQEPTRSQLFHKQKRPGSSKIPIEKKPTNETISPVAKSSTSGDNRSMGSNASIRTSIFQGDADDTVISEEEEEEKEETELMQHKKRGGLSTMNLKGLSKILSPTRSFHGEPSASSSPIKPSSSEALATGTSHPEHLSRVDYEQQSSTRSQKQDGASASEPVSPSPKSPVTHWRNAQSLATLNASNKATSSQSVTSPPAETDNSTFYKPFSGDLNIFVEEASPESGSPEKVFSTLQTEQASGDADISEQSVAKDALETIIEGPLETISEDKFEDEASSRKRLISESELEAIPEAEDSYSILESKKLLDD